MGSLCGKETSSHPFDAPGRTLGSGPGATALRTQNPPFSARIPPSVAAATTNKPKQRDRTLSSGASASADPRVTAAQAAAQAAEVLPPPHPRPGSRMCAWVD